MGYSVTIYNDSSLMDGEGAVHTWLKLDADGKASKYFSFSNSDAPSLIGIDSLGKSSVDDHLIVRKPTESVTLNITKQQYDVLLREFDEFYKREPKPNYDLTPDNEGDYNCVTASRTILQIAGIYYLNDIQTPFGVKYKMKNGQSSSALEAILQSRDDFDKSAKELIRYFEIFITKGFDSKDILTRISFDSKRPITIPYGCRNNEFADFYLNYGGEINRLHEAARFGHLDIVKFVVENQNIDFSIKNANDNTPLHYAARYGRLNVVQYLIEEKNADFNVKNKMKMTSLHFASLGGHFEVAEYLVDKYIQSNTQFNVQDDVYGATPLHYAASSGNLALVSHFINKGANVNEFSYSGNTPLHYAVSPGGNLEIVKRLIENGAIISHQSYYGTPIIQYAALGGHLDIVRYLIENLNVDYDVKSSGIHTLHFAVRGGLPIVEYLIEQKHANVDVKDNVDSTPLHVAINCDNLQIVRYLLNKGANTHVKNKLNETPLDTANKRHYTNIIQCLESIDSCKSQRERRSLKTEPIPGHIFIGNNDFHHGNLLDHQPLPAIDTQTKGDTKGQLFEGNITLMTTMLIDLIARKYTGVKFQPATSVLTDFQLKDDQIDEAEKRFEQAMLKKFEE